MQGQRQAWPIRTSAAAPATAAGGTAMHISLLSRTPLLNPRQINGVPILTQRLIYGQDGLNWTARVRSANRHRLHVCQIQARLFLDKTFGGPVYPCMDSRNGAVDSTSLRGGSELAVFDQAIQIFNT